MLSTDISERELLDALPVGLYSTDLDGRVTTVHHPAPDATTVAASLDDLRGRPIWEVFGEALPPDEVRQAIALLRAGRAPIVRWEVTRGRADDQRVLLAQMTAVHDSARAATGFVVSTTDISGSHHVREAALDAAVALSYPVDPDQACAEAAQQLRRELRPDLIVVALASDDGATMRIVHDSGLGGDRRALEQRFEPGWRAALETRATSASVSESGVELAAPLVGHAGPLGAITVVIDRTDSPEKLADARRFLASVASLTAAAIDRARLVANARHRRRVDTIREVAAGVAHELRNPVFGISSAAQLLRFRAQEDPVLEKNVGRILREVERLNRMVTTLLDLGRPVALKLSAGDPDVVWDDVLASERGRLESRAIAVRRIRPPTAASVPIDAEQLAQAFRGILANAVEAAPEASDVTLQSTILPNHSWRCRLTNGGPPIAPDLLPRIFELFLSTKPGNAGIGLGLAQRIIEDHHGSISIESTIENGTTVLVTLPPD